MRGAPQVQELQEQTQEVDGGAAPGAGKERGARGTVEVPEGGRAPIPWRHAGVRKSL